MDVSDDDMYLKVTNSQYLENKYHKLIDDDNEELHEVCVYLRPDAHMLHHR